MKYQTSRILLATLIAATLAASPLVAASCKDAGNWREAKLLDPPLRGRVSVDVEDPADGWTVTDVKYFVRTGNGPWGSALEEETSDTLLDGTRKRLWQAEIQTYLNDSSNKSKTNRVRIQFENAAGDDVVCAVHFEGKDFTAGKDKQARFLSATCWDESGVGVNVDNDTHPYVSCERNFLNGENRFNVVLKLKDQ